MHKSQFEPRFRDILMEEAGQTGLYTSDQPNSTRSIAKQADELQGENMITLHLMRGNKEEALKLAIDRQLWPFALLISSRVSKAAYQGLPSLTHSFLR